MSCLHTKEATELKATSLNRSMVMLAAVLAVACMAGSAHASSPEFTVVPNHVDISETFKGASLLIEAAIPKDAQAVVEITGAAHDEHLLKKGRRGGLWMSVGEVRVKGAPLVYLLMTTGGDLLSDGSNIANWGYEAIRKHLQFSGTVGQGHDENLFREFVKLKESNGLYGIFPDSLKITPASGDLSKLVGRMTLPGNIAAGTYQVTLSLIGPEKKITRRSTELIIDIKGLPALLDSLAHHHAVVYGLVSVIIALVTGLVTGYVFKSKSAH
jgi:hypothetical protein